MYQFVYAKIASYILTKVAKNKATVVQSPLNYSAGNLCALYLIKCYKNICYKRITYFSFGNNQIFNYFYLIFNKNPSLLPLTKS